MLYVVETFSGIGSQAKALKRANIKHKILATCDWDINAIIAYDIIHNGKQNLSYWESKSNDELKEAVSKLSISSNSKTPLSEKSKLNLSRETKIRLLSAIDRTNNKLDITSIDGTSLPDEMNLLTYSFPCQDLSLAGNWQGNKGGIDKNAQNRSSLLWQIERILQERDDANKPLPRFLLMENVTNIRSKNHIDNFNLWKKTLEGFGYFHIVLDLDARNFCIPQSRIRTFMISVLCKDKKIFEDLLFQFGDFENLNLSNNKPFHKAYEYIGVNKKTVSEIIKTDYENPYYFREAEYSNPNKTPSREEIKHNNIFITEDLDCIPTITTKQDRHPNSGLIKYSSNKEGKEDYRYLTPRECFMFMGFDEEDFQALVDENFTAKRVDFFSRDKLNRMAGNSICVNVLESIFRFIDDVNDYLDII